MIRLSPEVREALGASAMRFGEGFSALNVNGQFLVAVNARSNRIGAPMFAGIDYAEKTRRRAAGKRQRAARRITRLAAA